MAEVDYPLTFSVEYPDRPLNRVSTGFRIFAAIPILIVLGALPLVWFLLSTFPKLRKGPTVEADLRQSEGR